MRQKKSQEEIVLCFCAIPCAKEHEGKWAVRERQGEGEFSFRLSLKCLTGAIEQGIACIRSSAERSGLEFTWRLLQHMCGVETLGYNSQKDDSVRITHYKGKLGDLGSFKRQTLEESTKGTEESIKNQEDVVCQRSKKKQVSTVSVLQRRQVT